MAIFILLFKFIQKEIFYKHQYLSIIIITVLGIINYILNIILGDTRTDYSTKEIILIIVLVIICPFFFAFFVFMAKKYMKYKYYSPLFLCFMIGAVFNVISLILLIYCNSIDFTISYICDKLDIDTKIIFLFILDSILNGILVLLQGLIINDYTVFHLMLVYCLKDTTDQFFYISADFKAKYIITIIIKTIEFLFGLVFLEIIELNFYGLNVNLKRYIITRGDDEKKDIDNNLISEQENDNENKDNKNPEIYIGQNNEMVVLNDNSYIDE